MRRLAVRCLGILLGVSMIAVTAGVFWAWDSYRAEGPLEKPVTIIIPKGTGVQDIAGLLTSAGAIDNVRLFVLGAQYTWAARRMRAGEFALTPGMSMRAVADHLVNGETVKRRLTVPEGLLTEEVVSLVAATEGLIGDVPVDRPDGIYLPETYFFSYGDTRASVLSRMKKAMDQALNEAWAARARRISITSAREALILASIIERETGVEVERAEVSGVFHNRLRRKMRLQSDPTVAYAVTGGGRPLGRPLTRSDLYTDSDYNTYRRVGLPPGPIANPGRAALMAAVRPAETNFLYFVADGTGGHAFAETLREHNRNVAKWRRINRQRVK